MKYEDKHVIVCFILVFPAASRAWRSSEGDSKNFMFNCFTTAVLLLLYYCFTAHLYFRQRLVHRGVRRRPQGFAVPLRERRSKECSRPLRGADIGKHSEEAAAATSDGRVSPVQNC